MSSASAAAALTTVAAGMTITAPTPLPGKPTLVAGSFLLEYTSLESVLAALKMSSLAELEAVLAVSDKWPFPAHMDGWKQAHDAIRFEMDTLLTAIEKTKSLVEQGHGLQQWQVSALQLVTANFYHGVHKHHDHEEEIFFPFMASRVTVPQKMSADHRTLMALMDKALALVNALRPSHNGAIARPVLSDLHTTFSVLRLCMRQHLEEEEAVGLPLLRAAFSAKELTVPEKKILKGLKPADMAWFVRRLAMDQKMAMMQQHGIPFLVQRLVLLPAIRKDTRTYVHAYMQLVAGEVLPLKTSKQQKRGLASCFAA
ncbi:hypothetical protein CHLRE_01g013450v5 [Chlamydomonas reinhardtii]|jgi:hemerythrin-like domain-containing protein|uniref:Hemerythrin-like domain-containing protein n=1 Tax=Chlamydomonas reinhardtii TaxID=3055 RepID=A8HPF0_CHLRE|nr:uncharacterized protein CHLRE_01g013450v5 [Chlamydomonas reinhardtii]PNW88082.1 hypothetical protein CHLRE_01g013450v5 [Chlamydomonas reinhardtii]|eukprot:XP_001689447.1 predicted protein [Chlamydomonas reinhardtii]